MSVSVIFSNEMHFGCDRIGIDLTDKEEPVPPETSTGNCRRLLTCINGIAKKVEKSNVFTVADTQSFDALYVSNSERQKDRVSQMTTINGPKSTKVLRVMSKESNSPVDSSSSRLSQVLPKRSQVE